MVTGNKQSNGDGNDHNNAICTRSNVSNTLNFVKTEDTGCVDN